MTVQPASPRAADPRGGRRGALGAWVAAEIAAWVPQAGLQAGDPLPSEAELATTYDVSVRVIRDALRILSSQGVIVTSQGRRAALANSPSAAVEGYFKFATASDQAAVLELFEVRLALESRAAGLAAVHAGPDDHAAIRRALDEMNRTAGELEAYADADLAWHAAVVAASHNRFLGGIHAALAQILRTERISGVTMRYRAGDSGSRTLQDHTAISDAIIAADRERAEELMRLHLDRARALYDAYLAAEG
jgi:GntR family transcriptional repressor for pyruvate dehydrogenase complex